MPILPNAQNVVINGGQFTDITNLGSLTGIDILLDASYPGAAHDSSDRAYSPRCFPGTREQYIEDIEHWGVPTLGDTPAPLYWMKGPAGVGKSAIAQTSAQKLKEMEKLGAAFFFSVNGRNDPEKLFPSIAYQLSTIHPPYHDLLDGKIRRDKTLVKKALESQFRYLIDEPLRELGAQGKEIGRRVVIIDGLDECEGSNAQCEIIRIIAKAASGGTLPLCWAFFSRSEPHIEATFTSNTIAPHCQNVILPISRDADGEIELYLRNGFKNIRQRRNTPTPLQWPSEEDLVTIVGAAHGSFIYATTVLRFVDHLGSLGSQKRLRAIIDVILERHRRDPRANSNIDAPFAELDASYTLILQRIPSEMFLSVHLLFALLCRWGSLSAMMAVNALRLPQDEFETICNHASAVVHFRDPGKDIELDPTIDPSCTFKEIGAQAALGKLFEEVRYELGGQVSFYHKSFKDFLLDPARSGSYCVWNSEALSKHYLKIHLDYDRTSCWKGSELVLAPGVPDSGSSLSRPYRNEVVNSLIKARIYVDTGDEDTGSFSAPGGFGASDVDRDFRKHLHTLTNLVSAPNSLPNNGFLWGCECRAISYPGTLISWIPLAKFNVAAFKLMVEKRRKAGVIQKYHPNLSSRIKLFFQKKPQHFECALYRMGRREKSTFWYWEIDYGVHHYREFRTTNLTAGERLFQEENFNSWPNWG